jgi:hypothetical protein
MLNKPKEQKYVVAAQKSEAKKKIEDAIQNGALVFAASSRKAGASSPQ